MTEKNRFFVWMEKWRFHLSNLKCSRPGTLVTRLAKKAVDRQVLAGSTVKQDKMVSNGKNHDVWCMYYIHRWYQIMNVYFCISFFIWFHLLIQLYIVHLLVYFLYCGCALLPSIAELHESTKWKYRCNLNWDCASYSHWWMQMVRSEYFLNFIQWCQFKG